MKYLSLLLFCSMAFSQVKPVEITIKNLTSANDEDGRNYALTFTIANRTDKTIHFILNPNNVIPIGSGSLNPSIYYKVYENEMPIDVSTIFRGKKITTYFKNQEEAQKHTDSLVNAYKNKTQKILEEEFNERVRKNFQELQPNEEKQFEASLNWDKTRYFRNDVVEYYISETEKHFFELQINLMQDELLRLFTTEEKMALLKDKNMVKGWFTSQKVEVDFNP